MRAWDDARAAAASAGVRIRPLKTLEDADAAVGVMRATWGDAQLLPREVFRAFQESRSVVHGAFADEHMIGFSLGWFGKDDSGWHLHSHMVAVLPDRRSSGVGFALKLAQRAATRDAGVERIRWTFDPLQSRNAWMNLGKLGAVADAFHRDFYGEMNDVLNAGDRSDRLVVRWDLDAFPPVADAVWQQAPLLARSDSGPRPKPELTAARISAPTFIEIPRDYPALRREDRALGMAWRDAVADAMQTCFAAGLIARGFTRDLVYVFA